MYECASCRCTNVQVTCEQVYKCTNVQVARLQRCKATMLQSCKVANLQSCKVATLQCCKVARLLATSHRAHGTVIHYGFLSGDTNCVCTMVRVYKCTSDPLFLDRTQILRSIEILVQFQVGELKKQ